MSDTETTPPIVVRESAAKDVANSTLRTILIAGFAIGASQFIESEVVLATIVAVGAMIAGFVATYLVGIHKLLQNHRKLRFLAHRAPDDVATVVRK